MRTPAKSLLFAVLAWSLPSLCAFADQGRPFHLFSLYHVGFWVRDIAKSRAFYHDYLGFEEPYDLHYADGTLQMVVMKVNERQVIYLFPNAAKIQPDGDNLDHLGLETDDAAALHDYLAARGLRVAPAHLGHIGDLILTVRDPDGHPFEITQLEPQGQLRLHQGKSLAAARISTHLASAAVTVADLAASLKFYRDILGFTETGRSGGRGGQPLSVHLRVPDGTDTLDLRPGPGTAGAKPRAVPEFTLAVPDAAAAAATLAQRAAVGNFSPPAVLSRGSDGNRQTSCVDPDGTRVVLAEP